MVPWRAAIVIAIAACSPKAAAPAAGSASGTVAATCEQLAFAESTPVPEASGAAWMTIDGKPELVVISDSGNGGAYAIVDPDSGATIEQGKLPLGGGSDDLEGAAGRGDKLYAISSAGWIRVWKRKDQGFELVDGPYALGPIDLPITGGLGDKPPNGDGLVCPLAGTNCGRNYEGLCLRPRAASGLNPLLCTGFAASKADGHLYCITEGNQPNDLAIHKASDELDRTGARVGAHRAIAIARPGVVADCAFSDDGSLWVGNNLFGMSEVYRVDDSIDPEHAKVVEIAPIGVGFPETLAVRGDVIYRMSDTGGAPSLMAKFRCSAIAR